MTEIILQGSKGEWESFRKEVNKSYGSQFCAFSSGALYLCKIASYSVNTIK